MELEELLSSHPSSGKIINLPSKLTKSQIYACDPLYKNYLYDTEVQLNHVLITINTLKIDPESPKTKRALEICKLKYEQILPKERADFRKKDELIQFTEKRYLIHQLQISQLRKQVILTRNQLKNEERVLKRKSVSVLDQSWSSVQHSEQLKSPTEVIENWIETHFSRSNKYLAKLNHIKQQKDSQQKQQEEKQVKFVQINQKQTEKKRQKRMLVIQERKQRASEQNSKSMEIKMKMNQASKEKLQQSLKKKEIERQASINLEKRIEQLKQQFTDQIEQRQLEYNQKQQRAIQIKQESELTKSTIAQLQLLKTERNGDETQQQHKNKQSSIDIWSVRLPNILQKNEQKYQEEQQNNLFYVVNKFKRNFSQRSFKSTHTKEDSFKQEQQRQRYSSKQEYYNNRSQQVQDKLKKKDDYLVNLVKQKQNLLENKFTKIKNQINDAETRHEIIQRQYHDKLNQQLEREIQKHRSNISLIKQREQAIEDLKFLQQFDKSRSSLSTIKPTKLK